MKSRRVILTYEVISDLPLWALRRMKLSLLLKDWSVIHLDFNQDKTHHIVQVQANAIRPEPQPRSQRARMAKFAKDDAERADPKRPGWFSDRIAEVQSKPERKAKRAKGAK